MLVRRISPFEGSPRASAAEYVLGGDVSSQASHLSLHHIVRVCLPVTSPPLKGAGGMLLPSLPPVPTSYCSCMVARRISPFEGSPRASAAEYVLGGMLLPSLPPVPTSYCSCMLARRISPFEGSPRASAAEYVLGGMFPPNPQKTLLH